MADIDRAAPTDGGALVARALKAAGVGTLFALHGGHLDSVLKGLMDEGIAIIDTRHEASAGHAAEAWARLTGGLGVSMITAGPGFTNAITSIVNAQLDGTPVLYLIGAPPLREAGLNVLQGGIDQMALAAPAAKHCLRVTDPDRIPDQIAHAITIALGGRPGPVVVELPIDVLARPAAAPVEPPLPPRPTAPSSAFVADVVRLLEGASRPVAVLGGLARFEAREQQVLGLLDRVGIPMVFTSKAMGLVPHSHPAYAHEPTSLAVAIAGGTPPDLILMLGARYGMFLGGRTRGLFPEGARIVQVHADPAELGRIHRPDAWTTASVGEVADALAAAWPHPAERFHGWRQALAKAATAVGQEFAEPASGPIHPYFAVREIVAAAPADASFVYEGGEAGLWAAYHLRANHPGGVLGYGQLGCLGTGMGFALGAACARRGAPVIQITGDGAAGFHLQEFESFARHRLPIITVVLNNRGWGMSLHGQQILYGPNYSCIADLGDVRYHEVAAAFGGHGERVTRLEEIGPAIARALASGGPACIDVMVDMGVVAPGTGAMLGDPLPDEIMVPYYENIPLKGPRA